ncbi:MAG: hypothetical protein ACT4PZ_24065 [Panacagrimonas sp.]
MKKTAFLAGAVWLLGSTAVPVSAAPAGNGVRFPALTQPLLGAVNAGGLVVPVAGLELPLVSTSLLQPLLAGPLGSSPSLPNALLQPGLALAAPLLFGVGLPALDGLSAPVLRPVAALVDPVLTDQVLATGIGLVQAVNGPGPGAPPGSGSAAP